MSGWLYRRNRAQAIEVIMQESRSDENAQVSRIIQKDTVRKEETPSLALSLLSKTGHQVHAQNIELTCIIWPTCRRGSASQRGRGQALWQVADQRGRRQGHLPGRLHPDPKPSLPPPHRWTICQQAVPKGSDANR